MGISKTALVTGANQGIGRVIALGLAKDFFHVWLLGRNVSQLESVAREIESSGGSAKILVSDVSDFEKISEICSPLSIDVLVNNAAIQSPIGHLKDVDFREFQKNIDVNLMGPVNLCQIFLRGRGTGQNRRKIINLAGGGAVKSRPFFTAYACAKVAIVRLTETLADENPGVDINAISPGAINTRMLDEVVNYVQSQGISDFEEALKRHENGGQSIDRAGDLVRFLASSKSDGVTGRLIAAQWDSWEDSDWITSLKKSQEMTKLRREVRPL